MKHFYVSSKDSNSGISKYAVDFYELILKDMGYIFVESHQEISTILSLISSRDFVHIELDIFQKKEIEILFLMLKANYKYVSVTLHNAPWIKYPFYEFRNPFLNTLSRFYDKYFNNFKPAIPNLQKIKTIYVFSEKEQEAVKQRYRLKNVQQLPYIINSTEIKKRPTVNNNFIYSDIIDKRKGIEYFLQLHQQLLQYYPEITFYITGLPAASEKSYYKFIKEKYQKNVHYYDPGKKEDINDISERATFALLPFKNYNLQGAVKRAVLENLKKGKIVFTSGVNGMPEIIKNGKTGFYLSGVLKNDIETFIQLFNNKSLIESVKEEAYNYLLVNHSAENVRKNLLN